MSNAVVSYQPQNINELTGFAARLAKSLIIPQQYRGKPDDVMAAVLWGWETAELSPMIALSCIDVIKGKAAYKAEAMAGIALKRGLILDMEETFEGTPGTDDYAAVCVVTKPNGKTHTSRFSLGMAKKAGLLSNDMYGKYLERMLRARARGYGIRDAAPHSFLGYSSEEVRAMAEPEPARGPELARDVTPPPEPEPIRAANTLPEAPPPISYPMLDRDKKLVHVEGHIEALRRYVEEKRDAEDKLAFARNNLRFLEAIQPKLKNGNLQRVTDEIAAIRAMDEEGVVEELDQDQTA